MANKLHKSSKPLAYSYVRMSTAIQMKGDSWRRQIAKCKKYAEDHGLELVDLSYEDIGVSAYSGENVETGALSRFLDAAEKGKIPKGSFLIVESLDRISRENVYTALSRFMAIIGTGINLVTLEDGAVYSSEKLDAGQLLGSIMIMHRANNESALKGARVAAAWEQKRNAAGDKKLTALCPAWLTLNRDKRSFSISDTKAKVVRDIFEWSKGGLGDYAIARRLNKLGIKPFGRAKDWGKSYVAKILQNRAVLGEFEPHKKIAKKRVSSGKIIENYFPKIVDEKTFNFVQLVRSNRRVGGGGRKGEFISNLFTNIAKCYYCGSSMHYVNKGAGSKGGTYLVCSGKMKGLDCCSEVWKYTHFESSFLFFMRELDLLEIAKKKQIKDDEDEGISLISKLENELSSLKLQRERIYDNFINEKSSSELSEYLKEKFENVEKEIKRINGELKKASKSKKTKKKLEYDAEKYQEIIHAFQRANDDDSVEYRFEIRSAINDIVQGIRVASIGRSRYTRTFHQGDRDFIPSISRPFYVVDFVGNNKRVISVAPDDPFSFELVGTFTTYEGEGIAVGGESWSGELNAQFTIELSEEETQKMLNTGIARTFSAFSDQHEEEQASSLPEKVPEKNRP